MPAERPPEDDDARDAQVHEDVHCEVGVAAHPVRFLGVRGVGRGAVAGEVEGDDAVGGGEDGGGGDVSEDGGAGGVAVDEEEGGIGVLEGVVRDVDLAVFRFQSEGGHVG